MTQTLSREELVEISISKLQELGKTSGRLLFQKALMWDLSLAAMEAEVEAAVQEVQDHFTDGGTCDGDVQAACRVFKLALLQEGRRLTSLIPESVREGSIQ